MHKAQKLALGALALIALAAPVLSGYDDGNDNNGGNRTIELIDDCDPRDLAWGAIGGCRLKNGDVTLAEFNLFLRSPLYDNFPFPPAPGDGVEPGLFLVGHPSWRNEPSHLVVEAGKHIRVRNVGGRAHTLTPVAQFGGGTVPPLNVGTRLAPECATAVRLEPGARVRMKADGEGIQRFQCCFHPWMRSTVRVVADDDDSDSDDN